MVNGVASAKSYMDDHQTVQLIQVLSLNEDDRLEVSANVRDYNGEEVSYNQFTILQL